MKYIPILMVCLLFPVSGKAQSAYAAANHDTAYQRVILQRARKIVEPIGLADTAKAQRVCDIVAGQYMALGEIHDSRDEAVKHLRILSNLDKTTINRLVDSVKSAASILIFNLHFTYLSRLSAELTPPEINMIKDGMTYGVLERTYNGYLAMLPTLTDEQKRYILSVLTEAREYAMDAASSEKKHEIFGKYKGRINNYLSGQGYDLKKAGEELKERQKSK